MFLNTSLHTLPNGCQTHTPAQHWCIQCSLQEKFLETSLLQVFSFLIENIHLIYFIILFCMYSIQ